MAVLSNMYDWFVRKAYLLDWVVASGLFTLSYFAPRITPTAVRHVTKGDPALSYPFQVPSQSDAHLYAFVIAVPLLSFALVSGLLRRNMADWHHATLGWWLAVSTIQLVNGFMACIGRYRPNFFAGMKEFSTGRGTVNSSLWIANRSFPQPAAAAGVCTAMYMFLWAAGQMQLFSRPSKGLLLKLLLALAPLGYALWLALLRVVEYWVDFSDFNAGCFLGIVVACLSYMLWYPWLTSPNSGIPKTEREGWAHGFTSQPQGPVAGDHLQQLQMSQQQHLANPDAGVHELPAFKPATTTGSV